ncbi:MAG: SIMPL domain-containing protein [Ignavibacteria bacterium]|nr:SIMPL domain-containing protein [Ignavibacteria bacterium]
MDAKNLSNVVQRISSDYGKVILTGFIIISCVLISAKALINRNKAEETISVTGIGTINFEADLAVSSGDFKRTDINLQNAYKMLNEDRKTVESFLRSKGITDKEMIFSSVAIEKMFSHLREGTTEKSIFIGFQLTQSVRVESKNVDQIERISRELTEIINKGVEFYSQPPSYYYTQLDSIKLAVISEATKNARLRAESIAKNANGNLGTLKNASMGVFQITAQNSDESISWSGSFNTASKKKTATTTVRLTYRMN